VFLLGGLSDAAAADGGADCASSSATAASDPANPNFAASASNLTSSPRKSFYFDFYCAIASIGRERSIFSI